MKLGIVVLYYVTDDNGDLLDIHLRQISENTTVPYTIYGVDNKLRRSFRKRVDREPNLKLLDLPKTDKTFVQEHAYYLEALTKAAIDDGCTHVATLHVDSFPVKRGWVEELTGMLTEKRPLAAILETENGDTSRPNPAGMIFTREFYEKYNPTYLLPHEVHKGPAFTEFMQRTGQAQYHSGIGYGFIMDQNGLDWVKLSRSNIRDDHHTMAGVYGDIFFHLGAATRGKWFYIDNRDLAFQWFSRKYHRLMRALDRRLPPELMKKVRAFMPTWMLWYFDRPAASARIFDRIRKQLYSQPERYLDFLRGKGPRPRSITERAARLIPTDPGTELPSQSSQPAA